MKKMYGSVETLDSEESGETKRNKRFRVESFNHSHSQVTIVLESRPIGLALNLKSLKLIYRTTVQIS